MITKHVGRESKILDPDVRKTILTYIEQGNYIKTACIAAGVSDTAFHNWISRAESPGEGDEVYVAFLSDFKKARAENIAHNLKNIQDASDNDSRQWTASAWLLERMEPSEYGKRVELDIGPSKVLLALQESARKTIETVSVELTTNNEV